MKKAIASVLAASMALSLAACGGSSTATSSSTATESTASSTTAESTASGDKVTLRMTYWNSEDTVKALLDYLGEAVPDVQIEYQFIDNSNYDTIVDTPLFHLPDSSSLMDSRVRTELIERVNTALQRPDVLEACISCSDDL